ncbi:UNVERIFIED_CONTAM: Vacuolar protein sorting-associated protein 13, partial [Sesamum calycinum]
EVLLENVELILEAFDYLRLPFAFRQGRVGKLSIKIPWKKLGWDPLIIILEDVYICISQRHDEEWCMDAVEKREFASKKAQLAAAELAKLSRRIIRLENLLSHTSLLRRSVEFSWVAKWFMNRMQPGYYWLLVHEANVDTLKLILPIAVCWNLALSSLG